MVPLLAGVLVDQLAGDTKVRRRLSSDVDPCDGWMSTYEVPISHALAAMLFGRGR